MPREKSPRTIALESSLTSRTKEAVLFEQLEEGKVRCFACGHRCVIPAGFDGICRVRFNEAGTLFAPRGYVSGLAVDPIEKKPFFHVLPGAPALSFGMLGCDYHCTFCQNWMTSQTLRDPDAVSRPQDIGAEEIVSLALQRGTPVIVSTYNEPLITSEWAIEVFTLAQATGLLCGFVSNGNATPEVLRYIRPFVSLYKVDLKAFRQESYRAMGGRLDTVLDTIRALVDMGFWVEVVTLLVPGMNDTTEELSGIARFLAGVSPDIPWHVTAYHADYKMTDRDDTTASDLLRAGELGRAAGLRHVYLGNLPGAVGDWENTRCSGCGAILVERSGYRVLKNRVTGGGRCPDCKAKIGGVWSAAATS